MRVVAGECKGRRLTSVPGQRTRPTSDRIKESLFSIIGPYFNGGNVLDLFAGTGALGLEALSRGCDTAVFVDSDPKAVDIVRKNIALCHYSDVATVFRLDANKALMLLAKQGAVFDYIFLDPPYRMKIIEELIGKLLTQRLLADKATVVAEFQTGYEAPPVIGTLQCQRRTVYGDTSLAIYTEEMNVE